MRRVPSRVTKLGVAALAGLSLLAHAGLAQAGEPATQTRTMTGALGVINPSVTGLGLPLFERGPRMLGYTLGDFGPQNPDDTAKTVRVTGTAVSTFPGRQVTLPADHFRLSGHAFRTFAAFPKVAHNTFDYDTTHATATFRVGGGALGECPGDGCTASGAGNVIQWCPPGSAPPAPAPGTEGARVGNWTCPGWSAPGTGNLGVRLRISNANPDPNEFGGTLSLVRDSTNSIVWRVVSSPPNTIVSRDPNPANRAWPGGAPYGQFAYNSLPNIAGGAQIYANLGPNGSVTATAGCTNPEGNVGTLFPGPPPNNPFPGSGVGGSNCGTGTIGSPGREWGFLLTTGTISGSDFFPGLAALSAGGTPFAPEVLFNAPGPPPNLLSPPFFFTRMGTDTTTMGTQRNIVMQGGGIAVDPRSQNLFFRVTDLRMNLPEPGVGLGLAAGAMALVGLVRSQRRR